LDGVSLGVSAVVTTLAGEFGYPPLLTASVLLLAVGVLATVLFFPKPAVDTAPMSGSPAEPGDAVPTQRLDQAALPD
jgi:hypothetical protein